MAHAVVVKKEEKVKAVFTDLGSDITEERFVRRFIEMYPEDWKRIQSTYRKEEEKTKPGKTHPMPRPEIYIHNMYVNAKKKLGKME